jgi:hypothetical protein
VLHITAVLHTGAHQLEPAGRITLGGQSTRSDPAGTNPLGGGGQPAEVDKLGSQLDWCSEGPALQPGRRQWCRTRPPSIYPAMASRVRLKSGGLAIPPTPLTEAGGGRRGPDAPLLAAGRAVLQLLVDAEARPHALGLTAGGFPRHPLYLPGDATPTELVTAP